MTYDTIINGGRWFDGTGSASAIRNLGITAGVVVEVSSGPLEPGPGTEVVDAHGQWVMPGSRTRL